MFLGAKLKPHDVGLIFYTPKPYPSGFLMFLHVLNEREKVNDNG